MRLRLKTDNRGNIKMETEHLKPEEIAICAEALIQNNFNELPKSYKKHLAECDTCFDEVNLVAETITELPEYKTHKPINYKPVFIGIAASVAVLIGVYFIINTPDKTPTLASDIAKDTIKPAKTEQITEKTENKNTKATPKTTKESNKDEAPKKESSINPQKKEQQLLAYANNEQMEKLVDRYSSGNMRGDAIEIKSPALIKTEGQFILEWENPEKETLYLEIYNNKGDKLIEEETTTSSYSPTKHYEKGLYYWKLIGEEFDLLFCGKIIIN